MPKIEKFEDLIAWQKARKLTKAIYLITRKQSFSKDFGLTNQIQRAAGSVMSNIAEGYERDSPNEFHRFLAIAKESCAEVRCQLYIALDVGYISDTEFTKLKSQAEEVGRIIGGLKKSVSQRK